MPKDRKPASITPLKTMRIFCEGLKTEPNYINAYLEHINSASRSSVIEIEPTKKTTAIQLVEEAVEFKNSKRSLPDDKFWVVYDRESTAKYSEKSHAYAYALAQQNDVKVAISNVCFEYWLLLHFCNTSAPYGSYDDLITNSPFRSEYRKASGKSYEKSTAGTFAVTARALLTARTRAKILNSSAKAASTKGKDKPFHLNPYVGVVDLLDAIDSFK